MPIIKIAELKSILKLFTIIPRMALFIILVLILLKNNVHDIVQMLNKNTA